MPCQPSAVRSFYELLEKTNLQRVQMGQNLREFDCCTNLSPKFKSMESDMHNLIPTFNWFLEIK